MMLAGSVLVFLYSIFHELERPIVGKLSTYQKYAFDLVVAVQLQVLKDVREHCFLVQFLWQHLDEAVAVDDLNRRLAPNQVLQVLG
eukprot:CAMPEP_0170457458 /NCGR_PEP_ID=MMETSP0123-20130129/4741_1 /TAXON_ID=182087 /ORGANISM="Favella ehrenbergii, Strain Fehren 1" /LENGTH=85 /DNA_ID=CAMNT_0010721253 /DNA_START=1358 /DNA_END=1615 /DNA_ORIENTATION=-